MNENISAVSNAHIKKIKELYISFDKYYLTENSKYQRDKTQQKYFRAKYKYHGKSVNAKIDDATIRSHLAGILYMGIYAPYESKVLIFDVDTKDCARDDTEILIQVLTQQFGINSNNIAVNYSGNKGFHCTLFLDESIPITTLKSFYKEVISTCGFSPTQVEFRPSNQGIKLPFAIHPDTHYRAWFVTGFGTDEPIRMIKSLDYLFEIEPMNDARRYFKTYTKPTMMITDNESVDVVNDFMNAYDGTQRDIDEIETDNKQVSDLLNTGLLKINGLRNEVTFKTAIYLHTIGYSQSDTVQLLTDIMINTKKKLPSVIDTPMNDIPNKTKAVVKHVYEIGYKYSSEYKNKKLLSWNKREINDILSLDDYHMKRLYFILMQHSKIHANSIENTFYMTYKQMGDLGADTNASRTLNHVNELVRLGKIEIVKHGSFDIATYKESKGKICRSFPNIYKIRQIKNPDTANIEIQKNCSFEKWLYVLHSNKVIRLLDYFSYYTRKEIIKANK